ncbi:uncharacterized protein SETTUDRAFT_174518 [Exserohilum turcica Et28A]|uniref:Uncharacterized protein n=1 Tax=Exserohilum turcicum (strain 28A) TaxID=671987 RepID=R0JTF6_EXST2|nr:uncharacterized protein SETTUDRAFT_174518 [Exserohilum turcica Et28A]EOA80824.1 hypothetical protein SETTUDRAFT_174518 [Exserohilum turcica Et28A]
MKFSTIAAIFVSLAIPASCIECYDAKPCSSFPCFGWCDGVFPATRIKGVEVPAQPGQCTCLF